MTDLRITNTNGVNGVVAGLPTTYTITVTNPLGPSDASGATVTDTFPATLTGVDVDLCTGTGGGACPASGSGDINTPVTVPVGATVVFTATGTVDPAATGELVNTAQVLPPAGTRQPDLGDRHRPRCHRHRGRRGDHQDGGSGLDRRRATRSSTRSPSPTPGRRTPRAWW